MFNQNIISVLNKIGEQPAWISFKHIVGTNKYSVHKQIEFSGINSWDRESRERKFGYLRSIRSELQQWHVLFKRGGHDEPPNAWKVVGVGCRQKQARKCKGSKSRHNQIHRENPIRTNLLSSSERSIADDIHPHALLGPGSPRSRLEHWGGRRLQPWRSGGLPLLWRWRRRRLACHNLMLNWRCPCVVDSVCSVSYQTTVIKAYGSGGSDGFCCNFLSKPNSSTKCCLYLNLHKLWGSYSCALINDVKSGRPGGSTSINLESLIMLS